MFKQVAQLVTILQKVGQILQYAQALHAGLTQFLHMVHNGPAGVVPSMASLPAFTPAASAPALGNPPAAIETPTASSAGSVSASSPAPYVFPGPPAPVDTSTIDGRNVAQ